LRRFLIDLWEPMGEIGPTNFGPGALAASKRKNAHRAEGDVQEVTATQALSLRIAYELKARRGKIDAVNVCGDQPAGRRA
jgi:hypothetical protein